MVSRMTWYRYRVPLRSAIHVGGRKLSHRDGLVVQLDDDAGNVGWGEAAPLPGFFGWKPIDELAAEVMAVRVDELEHRIDAKGFPGQSPSVAFALSSAEAWLSRVRSTGGLTPKSLSSAKLIGHDKQTGDLKDWDAVKLKIGNDLENDVARFDAVSNAVRSDVKIRLDANRRWSFREATEFVSWIDSDRVEFMEEPIDDAARIGEFVAKTGLSVAVDETLQEAGDESSILALSEVADLFVIKPTMIGSIKKCKWLEALMEGRGKGVVYSSAYETGIGMIGVLLALEFQRGISACGIGTYSSIGQDLLMKRLPIEEPKIGSEIRLHSVDVNMELLDRIK